jgi:hypothetical protein
MAQQAQQLPVIDVQVLLASLNATGANERLHLLALLAIIQRLEDNNAFLRLVVETNNPDIDISGVLEEMKAAARLKNYIVN